ncbi:hypothetical protein S820908_084 [Synechococcus phage S-CAM9]|uniref:Uncharacterized protein n=1 Tax=Synechococcus phage S-CAM9 TaxID=1883369 RepID=A0A1D8KPA4_9CAUD|nr:hypothetical protein S820908_084 [Synechococcus phage S-CAM9]
MSEIHEIKIRELNVPDIQPWVISTPQSIPVAPPVTVNIGLPIVDIPGCVEAHESNNKSKTLIKDDENGILTFCDGQIPSFDPIDFTPENLNITKPSKLPKTPNSNDQKTPELEIPVIPPQTVIIEEDTKVTEEISPEIPWTEEYLPSPSAVTTTASIALVATTSALMAKPLADILLKAVKPTIKKVMKKITTIRKKPIPVLSKGERQAEQRQMNHAVKELRSVFPRKKKRKE